MAALDLALAEAVTGSLTSTVLAFGSVAAIGLLGVMDSLLGEDEDVPDDGGDDGGDLFDDDAVAGEGDDEFAFDDGGGGGGEFDDFDVDGMEGEEGQAAQGGSVTQLDGRVDEIEAELDSLSSTVSTVRTENEQIGESVEEVEENVRKLLEIYKMVTKGVNPFVDEAGGEVPAASGDGSLGLFEDEEGADEGDLGDDVVDADAEEFFDEELEEEFDDEEDPEEDLDDEDPEEDLEDGESGGKSFEDLREEYEDESKWEGEESLDGEDADDEADDQLESTQPPSPRAAASGDGEKPYLREIPGGYATDLLVTEWIEYLVSESGPTSVERAITYYENVEWIDRRAAEQLRAFLSGHPASDAPEPAESGALSMDHHTTSLQYIARIDGDVRPDVPLPRHESADEDVLRH